MSTVQTDNSFFDEKVALRINSLSLIKKDKIKVLEAFGGDGYLWEAVKRNTEKHISTFRIDKKEDKKGVYMTGDNIKYLSSLDLSKFDIIDLDAYGSPFPQLEEVFSSSFQGVVHCTFIQTGMGRIDNGILLANGYTKEMIKKIPTLFSRNGINKFENYLSSKGVIEIFGYFLSRKNYLYFHK